MTMGRRATAFASYKVSGSIPIHAQAITRAVREQARQRRYLKDRAGSKGSRPTQARLRRASSSNACKSALSRLSSARTGIVSMNQAGKNKVMSGARRRGGGDGKRDWSGKGGAVRVDHGGRQESKK